MTATLNKYKEVMPAIFEIVPTLTKTVIENRFATVPPRPTPPAPPVPTGADVGNLFDDLVAKPTVEEAIAAQGGIRKLSAKHNMTRAKCQQIIEELKQGYALYSTVEVEDIIQE